MTIDFNQKMFHNQHSGPVGPHAHLFVWPFQFPRAQVDIFTLLVLSVENRNILNKFFYITAGESWKKMFANLAQ